MVEKDVHQGVRPGGRPADDARRIAGTAVASGSVGNVLLAFGVA
jgi:hypothetical protein